MNRTEPKLILTPSMRMLLFICTTVLCFFLVSIIAYIIMSKAGSSTAAMRILAVVIGSSYAYSVDNGGGYTGFELHNSMESVMDFAGIDAWAGRESTGVRRNSCIVCSSDNGGHVSDGSHYEHPYRRCNGWFQ